MQAPGQSAGDEGRSAEQHETVAELARRWGWSAKTVIRVFEDEPGVLILDRAETRFKRGYSRTISIWCDAAYSRITSSWFSGEYC
jgi:hypothetical protein